MGEILSLNEIEGIVNKVSYRSLIFSIDRLKMQLQSFTDWFHF